MTKPRLFTLGFLAATALVILVGAVGRGRPDAPPPAFADRALPATGAEMTPDPSATPQPPPGPDPPATPTPDDPPIPADPPAPAPEDEQTSTPTPTPTALPARPRHTGPARIIDRGVTTRRAVALTFDAGADRGYAEAILDELRRQRVRATFGMTGLWARANPDLVRRMAAEGHQLINHSYDHDSFTGLSTGRRPQTPAQRAWQLDTTEALINELTSACTVPFFRSPYGDTDTSVLRDLGASGYAYNVLWTIDSRGWLRYTAGQIIQRCLAQAVPGAIYVMHVGAQSQDGPALSAIILGLRDMGYTFETIEEILQP